MPFPAETIFWPGSIFILIFLSQVFSYWVRGLEVSDSTWQEPQDLCSSTRIGILHQICKLWHVSGGMARKILFTFIGQEIFLHCSASNECWHAGHRTPKVALKKRWNRLYCAKIARVVILSVTRAIIFLAAFPRISRTPLVANTDLLLQAAAIFPLPLRQLLQTAAVHTFVV